MYGLKTMGLVAWSSAHSQRMDSHIPAVSVSLDGMQAQAIEAAIEPALTTVNDNPHTAQPLDWVAQLAAQTLETFSYRGIMVDCIGVDTAPLMVVCSAFDAIDEPEPSQSVDKPMTAECTQLFDLMMRSIGMARNNIRLCTASQQTSITDARSVASLLTPQTRAVLLLDASMASSGASGAAFSESIERDTDSARLLPSQLPVWRIPHPELLLRTPSLKRLAWQNLKALRQAIALQDNA